MPLLQALFLQGAVGYSLSPLVLTNLLVNSAKTALCEQDQISTEL